jgi:hypothetical protein
MGQTMLDLTIRRVPDRRNVGRGHGASCLARLPITIVLHGRADATRLSILYEPS